jgi:alpha-galactosidase
VDAMRIGPDTAPSWEPYFHWLPWAGPLIKREPSMPSLRNALRHTLNLSTMHKHWWWNDPDCLLVRNTDTRLTIPEVKTAVTLVGLSGGMLVSSDDLRNLNSSRLHWISLLVPNLGLRGLPVDWLEHKMPTVYRVQVHGSGQDGQTGEGWQLVALLNWNSYPDSVCLRFDELGYKPGATLHVFDFWDNHYWRVTDPQKVFPDIPAHGCKLLRVCEVGTTPRLVGDTLHISQGAEIALRQVDENKLVIETVDMGRRVEGELCLWLPRPPKTATCNGEDIHLYINILGDGIHMFKMQFTGKGRVEMDF